MFPRPLHLSDQNVATAALLARLTGRPPIPLPPFLTGKLPMPHLPQLLGLPMGHHQQHFSPPGFLQGFHNNRDDGAESPIDGEFLFRHPLIKSLFFNLSIYLIAVD